MGSMAPVRLKTTLFWSVSALASAAGVGAAFTGWLSASPRLVVGGVALVLSAPASALAASRIGPAVDAADAADATPAEVVDRLDTVERSLRFTRIARAVSLLALSYAVVLGGCEIAGLIAARGTVVGYSLVTLGALAVYLPWTARRERGALALRAGLRRTLGDLKAGRNWGAE
jgi:hypothetical protein